MASLTKEEVKLNDAIKIFHDAMSDYRGDLITDFTGYKFHATLKSSPDDTDANAIAKMETSDFTTDATNSEVYGFMRTDTIDPAPSIGPEYYLDAQVVDPSGNVTTLLERKIYFTQDITRRVADT